MAIPIIIGPLRAPSSSLDFDKVIINKIALIDADKYKHKVAYRMYQALMDEGELHCKSLLNDKIESYLSYEVFNRFKADAYVFCFSAPSSKIFRNAIAQEKEYKGNRGKGTDPYFYTNKWDDMAYVFEYINDRYETLYMDDLEADDILAMVQNEHTFIYSEDKDLKQVPGWHWDSEKNKIIAVDETDGLRSLALQLLKGDSGDNIPGLKGFGEKAVEHFKQRIIIEGLDNQDILKAILDIYTDKLGLFKGYDTFVEMWSLLSMRINRGVYSQEKYAKIHTVINELCKMYSNDEK